MRILIRTSKTARWARRIGNLALPLTVLPVFMHRLRLVDSGTFHLIEITALVAALAGLVVSVAAFTRLWHTGDRGWSKAITGFVVSLICIAPFLYGANLARRSPAANDITTDSATPLPLSSAIAPPVLSDEAAEELSAAFPNVRARRYPLDAVRTFALLEQQALARGWEIGVRTGPASETGTGLLDAVVTTLLGWRDEVALRVQGDEQGSIVDMRSASLFRGETDLGANGERIEEFLTGLDTAVQLLLRDSPSTPAAEPEAEEAPAPGAGGGEG